MKKARSSGQSRKKKSAQARGAQNPAPVSHRPPLQTVDTQKDFDWRGLLTILIVVAGIVAYHNSFSGVFVLDDDTHIENNPRIRQIWPLSETLSGRRPVVDLSLAINYRISELNPWGYHAVNLTVHLLASLTLFGVVRRTILRTTPHDDVKGAAPWLALVIALIWVVHPLQTQSVTYLIQRAESMMGLFYLLTLYCVIRGVHSPHSGSWYTTAVVASALGMGSKGVMVTAPVTALVYDWLFISKSLGETMRRRWVLYAALAATWLVLVFCDVAPGVFDPSNRSATVGLGYKGIAPFDYLVTQVGVIAYYVKLSLWPKELCLDYAWPVARTMGEIVLPALVVGPLLAGTIWALVRRSWPGFVGAWFFLILAPTSSVIPIKDPMFEHRMYLPLAAVVVTVVVGVYAPWRRLFLVGRSSRRTLARAAAFAVVAVVVALSTRATIRRNQDYQSDLVMWRDTLDKRPDNPRVYLGLGTALYARGKAFESEQAFRRAVELKPNYVDAYYNLGNALADQDKYDEAIEAYRRSLRLRPRYAKAHYNLGNTLKAQGRPDEAVEAYRNAVRIEPTHISAWINLGNTLTLLKRLDEAVEAHRKALTINPRYANARFNLGHALRLQGKLEEALEELRLACEYDPNHGPAKRAYEAVRAQLHRPELP